jgi:hypothetical protein
LPGPRALWIVLWALLPALNAGINGLLDAGSRSPIWEQGRLLLFLNYAALTVGIVIALWLDDHDECRAMTVARLILDPLGL